MKAPRRQCIFCDNPVDSKEHIWSQWMHPFLDEGNEKKNYNRHTIIRDPDGSEELTGPTGKPGGVFDIQVREVCRPCNQGWMNDREQEVRPFLEPMLKGEAITITSEQTAELARWCAQKFIVMEHASRGTALTPRADREALRIGAQIPPYFRIYMGNHVSKSRSASMRHSHTLALTSEGPVPPLNGMDRNIQTISLVIGKIFVHLNAARVDGFDLESTYFVSRVWDECRIWPDPNSSCSWPHRPLLDNAGLSIMSAGLEQIIQSAKVTWIAKQF